MTNTQADKLGKRLREGSREKVDFTELENFRNSFEAVGQSVYRDIVACLKKNDEVITTKRNTKTRQSIIDKLKREEKLRLSQIQDVEGCRVVVLGTLKKQERVEGMLLEKLQSVCEKVTSKKRNQETGYRATHIIVKKDKKFYEIQLRTFAQDVWANIIEQLSKKDNGLKYGGGNAETQKYMMELSKDFARIDENENLSGNNLQKEISHALSRRAQ